MQFTFYFYDSSMSRNYCWMSCQTKVYSKWTDRKSRLVRMYAVESYKLVVFDSSKGSLPQVHFYTLALQRWTMLLNKHEPKPCNALWHYLVYSLYYIYLKSPMSFASNNIFSHFICAYLHDPLSFAASVLIILFDYLSWQVLSSVIQNSSFRDNNLARFIDVHNANWITTQINRIFIGSSKLWIILGAHCFRDKKRNCFFTGFEIVFSILFN